MKLNKPLSLIITLMLSFGAHAANSWHYATVIFAGSEPAGNYIKLSDNSKEPSFEGRLFKISTSIENEGLAAALAAISTNKQVYIETNIKNINPSAQPTVSRIYLTNKAVK